MTPSLKVLRALVPLFLLAAAIEFFLAGAGVFGAASFTIHAMLGSALVVVALVIAVIAAVAGPPYRSPGLLLVGLMLLQYLLVEVGTGISPWVAALHPVNALLIMAVAGRGLMAPLSEAEPA